MALEDDLVTTLKALPAVAAFTTRVHWGMAGGEWGQTVTPPALIVHLIDDVPQLTQSTEGGGSLNRARIQVDCIGTTQAQAKTLAAAVAGLHGRRGAAFSCIGAVTRDAHDAAAKRYRRMVDLDLWHTT